MSFIKAAISTISRVTGIGSVKEAAETLLGAIKGDPELEKALAQLELDRENSIRELYKAEVGSIEISNNSTFFKNLELYWFVQIEPLLFA